ncbi:unnamed protein product, partial [Didymodactylos carnosus]
MFTHSRCILGETSATLSLTSRIKLNDGNSIPIFGLGLYRQEASTVTANIVAKATELGYRLFDTAEVYENEQQTGDGLKAAQVKPSREEIFISTKVFTTEGGRHHFLQTFEQSLKKLQVDYIDLYFIHSPQGGHVLEVYDA